MLRIKNLKLIIVLAIVISLVFPYSTPVLAAVSSPTLKQSDFNIGSTLDLASKKEFEHDTKYRFNDDNIVNGNNVKKK